MLKRLLLLLLLEARETAGEIDVEARELQAGIGEGARELSLPGDERIVLLTTFHKQRSNERTEVARARQAMRRCIEEGHTAEGEET